MNKFYKNIIIILVCLIAVILLMSLSKNIANKQSSGDSQIEMNEENITENTEVEVDSSEVLVEDLRKVQSGDTISVNYTGKLVDGTVFDSNVLPEKGHVTPFVFTVGAGQVIKGWDEGFIGMSKGEKKTLTIPPEKAYGAGGVPGAIPGNATLIFEVELLEIK